MLRHVHSILMIGAGLLLGTLQNHALISIGVNCAYILASSQIAADMVNY